MVPLAVFTSDLTTLTDSSVAAAEDHGLVSSDAWFSFYLCTVWFQVMYGLVSSDAWFSFK